MNGVRKIEMYREVIDGIETEICFWSEERMKENRDLYPHGGIWNSYIYITEDSYPDFKKWMPRKKSHKYPSGKRVFYSYSDMPFEMAYGLSFFEPIRNYMTGKIRGFKIGNDYNHYWNEQQYVDYATVRSDLEESVKKILHNFPLTKK